MVQYETIREMSLKELLTYYQALKAICDKHESELRPLYGSNNPKDQIQWVEINNEYQHAKLYFDIVMNALKYKSFHGLDEYKPLSGSDKNKAKDAAVPVKKPIAKKPGRPAGRGTKKEKK